MLTPTQRTAVKAAIDADPLLAPLPNDSDSADFIARALNEATAHVVWRTDASVEAIQEQILWANMTPADVPDGSQAWANRSLACQGKQLNLQVLLTRPSGVLNGALAQVRVGLQDALTGVPSGVGGVAQTAGWAAVRLVLQRTALRIEQILASGAGTQGSPAVMTREGPITYQEVQEARAS